jgi:hypothetical protein
MAGFDRTNNRRRAAMLVNLLFVAGIVAPTGKLFAQQQAVKHLNPVIEKLAAGKPFIGFQTGDFSLENARNLARTDIDYVYLEMEHGPMDFEGMHRFTVGMIDKATISRRATLNRTWPSSPALPHMAGNRRSGSSSRRWMSV